MAWLGLRLESGVGKANVCTSSISIDSYIYTHHRLLIHDHPSVAPREMCNDYSERKSTSVDHGLDLGSHESKELALQLVQDKIRRFRIWAGNMGSHRLAGSRMSLDYKLKEELHIHNTVVESLEEMNTSLESAY